MALCAGTEPVPDVVAIGIVFLTDGHDSARLFVGTAPLKPSERYRSPGARSVVVADIHSTAKDRKKTEMRMNCGRVPLLLNIARGIDGVGEGGIFSRRQRGAANASERKRAIGARKVWRWRVEPNSFDGSAGDKHLVPFFPLLPLPLTPYLTDSLFVRLWTTRTTMEC